MNLLPSPPNTPQRHQAHNRELSRDIRASQQASPSRRRRPQPPSSSNNTIHPSQDENQPLPTPISQPSHQSLAQQERRQRERAERRDKTAKPQAQRPLTKAALAQQARRQRERQQKKAAVQEQQGPRAPLQEPPSRVLQALTNSTLLTPPQTQQPRQPLRTSQNDDVRHPQRQPREHENEPPRPQNQAPPVPPQAPVPGTRP
ncbi:hypothetical protein C8J57DRAFT_479662 [Mycena rebaudengoi]|nr:hypothetical protein C8J57DRAFT_479662 [Mycena rebaudengoi]